MTTDVYCVRCGTIQLYDAMAFIRPGEEWGLCQLCFDSMQQLTSQLLALDRDCTCQYCGLHAPARAMHYAAPGTSAGVCPDCADAIVAKHQAPDVPTDRLEKMWNNTEGAQPA
jgi:hypothetical protein